ncbi:hypothetical protein [Erythrobacter sp. Alg231-14]|uniref:hypothetical protein n=1 Tax=Erythrobacter sp. Alg231-14 TaxID=1922225 RepID=UPI00307BC44C
MDDDALKHDDQGRALPPWKAFPELERGSIHWRMGGGETYWCAFWDWYQAMDSERQIAFEVAYPSPKDWDDYYEFVRSNS